MCSMVSMAQASELGCTTSAKDSDEKMFACGAGFTPAMAGIKPAPQHIGDKPRPTSTIKGAAL
jgi:hypothetical protein